MKINRRLVLFAITVGALAALDETASSQTVSRGPYLQMGTPTSVDVRWRTTTATNSRVRYGSAPGSLTAMIDDATSTTEHEVRLTGLIPDTKYYYSIGTSTATLAGDDANHFFITSPASGKPTRIWILGDSGTKNDNQRAVRDAYYNFTGARHTDLWLMLGDNAYSNGTDSEYQLAVFQNMYEAMLRKSALWPTRGNHDSDQTAYYNIFTMPKNAEAGGLASGTEAYYSFDYGNIHFICLESTSSSLRAANSAQWTWLESDLAANDKNWTIAFWHHPPYSKGSHNSDSESQLIEMRQRALPRLEDGGVDLVLCGHSHSYERSFLIDGHYDVSSTFTAAMKKDGGNGRTDGNGAYTKNSVTPAPHAGAVYTVAGSSGHTSSGTLNHSVMFTSLKELGSVVLDIDGNRLDAKFIDNNGAVRDYFTMIKNSPLPATQLVEISGDDQTALAGSALPNPFVVEARDDLDNPVSGVAVTFEVTAGGGSLSNSQPQITGANGRAATTLTLGATPGANTVTASANGLAGSPLVFSATGEAPLPPTITSFTPTSGVVGTQVTINGSNFTGATEVAFNGTTAIGFTVISSTQIRANVPSGAITGTISVTTAAGAAISGADFNVQYSLTVTIVGSGTVNLSPSGGVYDFGSVVTLTANASPNYVFSNWSGNLSGSANPETITMNANKSVTATFTATGPAAAIKHEETQTGGSSNSTTVTSASLTVVSGQLYLAAIASKSSVTVSSVTGLGLSWTLVKSQCAGRNQTRVTVYMAQGTSSGNGAVTATFSSTPKNAVIAVSRYSGVAAMGSVGNVVSGNTKGVNGVCSGGSDNSSYSFNLTTTVNGAVAYGAVAMRNRLHTPGAGYTERAERRQGSGGDIASVAVQDKGVATASTVAVNGSFGIAVDWAMVGLEIKPEGATASQAPIAELDEPMTNHLPAAYNLRHYPNPFNASISIEYFLPEAHSVRLLIYNSLGQLVRRLVDEDQSAGAKRLIWNGANDNGLRVGSGVYFYRLEVGAHGLTGKMILQQ